MNNREMTEKAFFLVIIIGLIVAGIMYKEDFEGQPFAALVWFTICGIAAARLIYFIVKKR
jgi:hypothetical protein